MRGNRRLMRHRGHWRLAVAGLALLLLMLSAGVLAQDVPHAIFFLARDDTDQDGQVTDGDNIRLFEVSAEGTVLFATAPSLHILEYALSAQTLSVAVVAQTPENALVVQVYGDDGTLVSETPAPADYIEWIDWQTPLIIWASKQRDGQTLITRLDPVTGETQSSTEAITTWVDPITGAIQPSLPESRTPPRDLMLEGRPFLLQQPVTDTLLVVQDQGATSPNEALWLYDTQTEVLTPFSAWVSTEPLLLASRATPPMVALLGREFDGSMSLYTLDFTAPTAPQVAQPLTNLIDPAYTAMQWAADGSLLLVGPSGDFVVTTIGRVEAVYAFDITSGALARLSPENTLVERSSVRSR